MTQIKAFGGSIHKCGFAKSIHVLILMYLKRHFNLLLVYNLHNYYQFCGNLEDCHRSPSGILFFNVSNSTINLKMKFYRILGDKII